MASATQKAAASGFSLLELMLVVGIIACLSLIAVPTSIKYVRRSRSIEATTMLRKLYDGSVTYYVAQRAQRVGSGVGLQFPSSSELTPADRCCLRAGGKCLKQPGDWEAPTWRALHFSVDEPSFFQYQYRSDGIDSTALFTAGAYGDQNCDGSYSTFERAARTDERGEILGGGLYMVRDID